MNAERRETDDEKHGKVQSGFRYEEREKNGEKAENAPKKTGMRGEYAIYKIKNADIGQKNAGKRICLFFRKHACVSSRLRMYNKGIDGRM